MWAYIARGSKMVNESELSLATHPLTFVGLVVHTTSRNTSSINNKINLQKETNKKLDAKNQLDSTLTMAKNITNTNDHPTWIAIVSMVQSCYTKNGTRTISENLL